MKYKLNFDLNSIGILDWEDAEFLQTILPVELRRRKTFEGYYVDTKELLVEVSMKDLLDLSNWFTVQINCGYVSIVPSRGN